MGILPVRALAFAAMAAFGLASYGQSWTYSGGILTGADGMKLSASLSGTKVSVTGISNRGSLTTIDLRGPVTGPNGDEEYVIDKAEGISFSGLKELYLPETITFLGSFDGCSTLEKVEPMFPASLTGFKGYTCPAFARPSRSCG